MAPDMATQRPSTVDRSDAYFTATRESIVSFAAATTDQDVWPVGGLAVAPPLFPVVASQVPVRSSVEALARSTPALKGIVQVDHEMTLGAPVAASDILRSTAGLVVLGRGPLGTRARLAVDTRHVDGRPACAFWATLLFITGTSRVRNFGRHARRTPTPAPAGSTRPGSRSFAVSISEEQTARYAEVSGDWNPIHFDPDAAAGVALPGTVAHGLCVLATVVGRIAAENSLDAARLLRVYGRFAGPALLGERLTTTTWREASRSVDEFRFRTTSASRIVLKGGRVRFGS